MRVGATPVSSIEVRPVAEQALSDIRLAMRSLDAPDAPWRSPLLDIRHVDGVAVIDRIAAGRYSIAAAANVANPENAKPAILRGLVEVSSDGLAPQRATVKMEGGATVSGHVEFDGASVASGPRAYVRLTPFTVSAAPPLWGAITQSDAAGKFAMTDITPGQYRVESTVSKWLLRSATLAGRDVLDAPIDVSGGADYGDLVLTYTDRTATMIGSVTGGGSRSARVVIFPTDRRFWTNPNRVQVLTITAGAYESGPLLAGDYFVVALASADPTDLPGLLERGVSLATRVSVTEGRRVQNLVAR